MTTTSVTSGETSSGAAVTSGDELLVLSGGRTVSAVVLSAGLEFVFSGGLASATSVTSGGAELVSFGGTASGTLVSSGGTLVVLPGAAVAGTTGPGSVISTGLVLVGVGAPETAKTASRFTVQDNGQLYVLSGGTTDQVSVLSGSGEEVFGGTAGRTTVSSGARQDVGAGGTTTGTQVSNGGTATVSSGGSASYTTVSSGGTAIVSSGGSASYTTVSSGGTAIVSSGGRASYTTVSNGGVEDVSSGGVASRAMVSSGGYEVVYFGGTAASAVVSSGGQEFVFSGGSAIGTVVSSSGQQYVFTGGVATGTVVSSGGVGHVEYGGVASRTVVLAGGSEQVAGRGAASGTLVSSGGQEFVFSGGSAIGTVVSSGGYEVVSYGGSVTDLHAASGASVQDAGTVTLVNGDTAYGVTVLSSGLEAVSSGGMAINTVVSSGGTLDLLGGGQVISTTFKGGTEVADIGYTASGLTVQGGALQMLLVSSGGAARASVVSSSGTAIVSSGGTLNGATIAGGLLDVQVGAVASGSIAFAGTGGTLEIDAVPTGVGALLPDATVSGFDVGDTINLHGIAYDGAGSATLLGGNVLDVHEGGQDYTLQLDPTRSYAGEQFVLSDPQGTDVTVAPVCFCTGTRILTVRGEVAVEDLSIGDMAVTASGQHRPVRWIGQQELDCGAHPRPQEVWPVRVAAGALGEGRPSRDLWVSPGHALALDLLGEVLVPASALVNGATVVQVDVGRVAYWHVELDAHDVLLAEGQPAESYMDTGNRAFFGSGVGPLDPERAPGSLADYCRPFHDAGVLIAAARSQLRLRAAALGWRLGGDPLGGLHLIADGQRIEPEADGLSARFAVPAGARDVWLCSEAGVPMHGADDAHADRRLLGLCVGALQIDDGLTCARAVSHDDALLAEGWHAPEANHRWTGGRARLPSELWAGRRGLFFLRVNLAGPAVQRWTAPDGLALSEAPATGRMQCGLRLVHAA